MARRINERVVEDASGRWNTLRDADFAVDLPSNTNMRGVIHIPTFRTAKQAQALPSVMSTAKA
jgi:hypothetical protein